MCFSRELYLLGFQLHVSFIYKGPGGEAWTGLGVFFESFRRRRRRFGLLGTGSRDAEADGHQVATETSGGLGWLVGWSRKQSLPSGAVVIVLIFGTVRAKEAQ